MKDRDTLLIHLIVKQYKEMNATLEELNHSYERFSSDITKRKSIYLDILQIGENFNHLSEDTLSKINKKDVREIIDVRNFIAHGYTELDEKQIWEIANKDIPNLISYLEK